jgi:cytochrome c oxidase assembly protein subunit 15
MILAMIIMATLLFAAYEATSDFLTVEINDSIRRWLFWSGAILLGFTLSQLVVGTQVREAVDMVKNLSPTPPRDTWLEKVGSIDEYHRTLSWSVFLPGLLIGYLGIWKSKSELVKKLSLAIVAVIIFQIALGAGLYYLGMPPAYQVFHLVGVAVLICLEFLLLLIVK